MKSVPSGRNYLFGAGHFALSTKHYLEKQGIRFDGVIVTKKKYNIFDGIPVFEPDEVSSYSPDCCVFFALGEKYHCEVERMLQPYGFDNFVKFSDDELQQHYYEENNLKQILEAKYGENLPEKLERLNLWDRILIIRLDGIGDMVLSTPFFRELRRKCPASRISLITSKESYNLFECCPYLDEVIPIDWKGELMNSSELVNQLENAQKIMERTFQGVAFDVAIVPRYDTDYYGASYLALFSGAPYRVAFSENINEDKKRKNKDYDLIFSHIVSTAGVFHEVERTLQILHAIGLEISDDSLELWADENDYRIINGLLKFNYTSTTKKVIAIGLSAGIEGRIWPYDRYLSLIKEMISIYQDNCVFVLLGGDNELCQAKCIEDELGENVIINLCGKVSLRQVFVTLKYAKLFIGHDTGLMHIASAAKCAVVEICATPPNAPKNHPSSILRFGPWQTKCEILRPKDGYWDNGWRNSSGDFAICDIMVDDVLASVMNMLRMI